ncbi:hypothetical protein Tco_0578288 [Tanacetum coccineum]
MYLLRLCTTSPDEEEVTIDVIPLAVKSPSIVGWKIYKERRKGYYQIMRDDGKSQTYMIFSQMLKSFNRKYLEDLYKLVKAKYESTRLVEDLDFLLWGDLKIMFKPHVEDKIWRNQQDYKVLDWKLYDSCEVHSLRMQHMQIYMLVEKKYPLALLTLSMMLEKKLIIDYKSEMVYQFLKFIIKQLKKGGLLGLKVFLMLFGLLLLMFVVSTAQDCSAEVNAASENMLEVNAASENMLEVTTASEYQVNAANIDQDYAHMVAASKVPMLKPSEYEICRMRIEQYIQMIDYALYKKTQRNILKQQYENFTAPSSEMLNQTFDRLQNLVSQNKADLDTMSIGISPTQTSRCMNQKLKRMSSSSSSTQRQWLFVSTQDNNTSSTNEALILPHRVSPQATKLMAG